MDEPHWGLARAGRTRGAGRGLFSQLVERGVAEAQEMELAKLTVEVSAELRPVAAVFVERFGFVQEGLLRDHVDDAAGNRRDLLILSRFLDPG